MARADSGAEGERERDRTCVSSPSGTSLILGRVRSRNQLFNKWNPAPPTATWNYFGCSVLNYTRLIVTKYRISNWSMIAVSSYPPGKTKGYGARIGTEERNRMEYLLRVSNYFGYFESRAINYYEISGFSDRPLGCVYQDMYLINERKNVESLRNRTEYTEYTSFKLLHL